MRSEAAVLEVAVFAPLRKTFYYLSPADEINQNRSSDIHPGSLVRVPFGRGERFGIVVGEVDPQLSASLRLKPILELVDERPRLAPDLLRLAQWAADYYQHPLGEVLAASLPSGLRQGELARPAQTLEWLPTDAGRDALETLQARARRQAVVLELILRRPASADDFSLFDFDWRRPLRELEKKGFVSHRLRKPAQTSGHETVAALELNPEQQSAVAAVIATLGEFSVHLLHGVTGSGKTEVYMAIIEQALSLGRAALMLVPEIILTQQMVQRLKLRFGDAVAVLHSGLSERDRTEVWLRARSGKIKVLMGTRSAVWVPIENLGLIVVDEEHDGSLKQHDGFRYHARDVAVVRAHQCAVPIILGSATPSFEALLNVNKKKYNYLSLPQRTGVAEPPTLRCVDVRGLKLSGGLSDELCSAIATRLERGEQSLLFLNRRGFAPIVLCHECGWIARCERCDANLVWHKGRGALLCHHCGGRMRTESVKACCEQPALVPLGLGTEQIEEALNDRFPERRIARIDRDSMRRKGVMDATFAAIKNGDIDILIGTQMLAKGHDFSAVTLVGIVDADSQLFSTDFRAEEKLAQTIIQVAGRAGRAERPGTVLIQTHHPHHELLQLLITGGYDRFAERALAERSEAELPPFVPMALIRAESPRADQPLKFLRELGTKLGARNFAAVEILGPIPAAMEKKAGRYRAQLMLSANTRARLAHAVKILIELSDSVALKRHVRWSIDIDPQDTM